MIRSLERHGRPLPLEQRHHRAERGVDAGDRVADRNPCAHRRPVGITDQFPEAAVCLGDGGETWAFGHRTGLPERRDAGDHEVRVGFVEYLGA